MKKRVFLWTAFIFLMCLCSCNKSNADMDDSTPVMAELSASDFLDTTRLRDENYAAVIILKLNKK